MFHLYINWAWHFGPLELWCFLSNLNPPRSHGVALHRNTWCSFVPNRCKLGILPRQTFFKFNDFAIVEKKVVHLKRRPAIFSTSLETDPPVIHLHTSTKGWKINLILKLTEFPPPPTNVLKLHLFLFLINKFMYDFMIILSHTVRFDVQLLWLVQPRVQRAVSYLGKCYRLLNVHACPHLDPYQCRLPVYHCWWWSVSGDYLN